MGFQDLDGAAIAVVCGDNGINQYRLENCYNHIRRAGLKPSQALIAIQAIYPYLKKISKATPDMVAIHLLDFYYLAIGEKLIDLHNGKKLETLPRNATVSTAIILNNLEGTPEV